MGKGQPLLGGKGWWDCNTRGEDGDVQVVGEVSQSKTVRILPLRSGREMTWDEGMEMEKGVAGLAIQIICLHIFK